MGSHEPGRTAHRETEMLFVGGSRAVPISVAMAIEALAQADARGIRTHLTNKASVLAATPSVRAAAHAVSAVDFTSPGETERWALRQRARGRRFDLVFALQEMAQVTAAETARALGLPGNPPDAVRCIRAKDLCRAKLAAAGFPQPAVRLCGSIQEAADFLTRSAGPWIVKPRDAMGSVGVSQIRHASGLPAALALLPDDRPFLVEEFVEGPELSVEGIFLGGVPRVLAVTAKEKTPPPYFVEIGHILPAGLPEARRRQIELQVTAALTALGLRTGAFHVELWLTATGIVLGEVHGRFGGAWIHRMLAHVIPGLEPFGLIYDDLLAQACGQPAGQRTGPATGQPAGRVGPYGPLRPVRGAAVRYLLPPPGRVVRIDGWDRVLSHPAVLHAELTVTEGDVVRPVRESGDRVGLVAVGAATSGQARALASELAASVSFTVDQAECS
jgi:hypothetical protein